MKKVILALALILTASISLISCRETEKETKTIVKEVEAETEAKPKISLKPQNKTLKKQSNTKNITKYINSFKQDGIQVLKMMTEKELSYLLEYTNKKYFNMVLFSETTKIYSPQYHCYISDNNITSITQIQNVIG